MKHRVKRLLVIILIIGGLIFIIIKIRSGFSKLDKDSESILPSTFTILPEDSMMICENYIKEVAVKEVVRDKYRNPFSFLVLGNKYNVMIYKFPLLRDVSLLGLINLKNKSVFQSTGYSYRIIDNKLPFRFRYKLGKTSPISQFFLTVSGDSFREIQTTENLVGYSLRCSNFSIRYSEREPIDLFFEGKGYNDKVPSNLFFLKTGQDIFFILISSMNLNEEISTDIPLKPIRPNCEP